jgi:hypothetical protein
MNFPAFPELASKPTPEAAQYVFFSQSFYPFGILGFQESNEFT